MTEQERAADPEVPSEAVPAVDDDYLEPGQTMLAVEPEVVVDDETMRRALEAILMVTDEPLPVLTLARTIGRPTGDIAAALAALAEEYSAQGRGFDLREVAGGWRYYTREEAAAYVERFVLDGQQARLTQAALETLAVVAYKQPVSRARVSAIRGVNVDGVMRTLVSRGLVEEAGADTESQATLYRTTSYFLERMGMQSLDDLPELAPYLPEMDDMEEELAAQAAGSDPEPTADPASDTQSGTGPGTEPGTEADTEPATEADAEPGAETEPEAETEAGAETEPGAEAEPELGSVGDLADEPVTAGRPGAEPPAEPEELPDSAYGPESVDEPESVLDSDSGPAADPGGTGMETPSVDRTDD